MKKILLVFDGINFSHGAFEFVKHLNILEPVLVVAVFVPEVDYASLWTYSAAASVGAGVAYVPVAENESEIVETNIQRFKDLCHANGIQYRLHKELSDFSTSELKVESRFADIMILSGELFYKDVIMSNQFEYLKNVLQASESPVMIVPENYKFPDNNILAYDGTEESVYAIKQFAYVFPELAKNKTLLVYADKNEENIIPDKDAIRELAAQHYKSLDIYKLSINPKKYFNDWIEEKKGAILVSGSFGRSGLSQMFKKSFVRDIIMDHKVPVFIAHR